MDSRFVYGEDEGLTGVVDEWSEWEATQLQVVEISEIFFLFGLTIWFRRNNMQRNTVFSEVK